MRWWEAFDRLALLAASLAPTDVIALVGAALQAEALPFQVQSIVLALDGDESGQKAGLAVTLCAVPQDGQGKDWSERWRTVPDGDGVYPVIEAWVDGNDEVEEAGVREGSQ